MWTPSAGEQRNLPVLVFSHALYMCPTQSRYLTGALADAGYLVVAPRHGDSSCSFSVWPSLSRWSAKPSPMWTEDDYRDRADDIRTVVAALPRDPRYRDVADMGRLALAGHSLGGYTVLGLGGAWQRCEEDFAVTERAWRPGQRSVQVRWEPLKGTEKAAFG